MVSSGVGSKPSSSNPGAGKKCSAVLGDRERAIAAGFDSYIAKPIDLCEVEAQLDAFASRPCVGNDTPSRVEQSAHSPRVDTVTSTANVS